MSGKPRHRKSAALPFSVSMSFLIALHTQAVSSELDEDDHQAIAHMDIFMHGTDDDVSAVVNTVPLGEEGIETSHEGGEYEVFENLANEMASAGG